VLLSTDGRLQRVDSGGQELTAALPEDSLLTLVDLVPDAAGGVVALAGMKGAFASSPNLAREDYPFFFRFDEALRPFGLTNGQFSLLMSLNRPAAPRIGDIAAFLAMDRTTLTANLKPLERRGLIAVVADANDKRSRRLMLTDAGRDALVAAVPVWRATHDDVDKLMSDAGPERIRAELGRLE
jgi:DNA-binding MarR family transcriptional regulator